MLGTAFPASRLLLIEQRLPWGSAGLGDSRLEPETYRRLAARCRDSGVRLQAIRRVGGAVDGQRRWALVDTNAETRSVIWGRFDADRELVDLPLRCDRSPQSPPPAYLVCTHGAHDLCCAQRGRPVAVALAKLRPDAVWQTSHLGGCRFAPSVLTIPAGLMYGRLTADDAEHLIAVTEAGSLLRANLRGWIGLPPAAQAALGYAADVFDEDISAGLRVEAVRAIAAGSAVDLVGPEVRCVIIVGHEPISADGLTCRTPGPGRFFEYPLIRLEIVPFGADAGADCRASEPY